MDDEAGFTAFVAARGPGLLRLGWLLTADPDAAQDLAQEALARLARHWDRVCRDGNPEGYARAALRSTWIDSWRRRHGWTVRSVADPQQLAPFDRGPAARPADPDLSATRLDVADALRLLGPRQRAVLVLRFYEDLTEVETARALGISTSTVKSQTRDALARLRVLAPWLDDDWDEEAQVAR